LIVENVSQKALRLLKNKGIIVGFVNKLFGEEYEELLKSLIAIVTNAGAILKENPDKYLKLIEQLDKLVAGKINNLRGDLFELAVGYYYSNNCQNLDIGKKINFDGKTREIDVWAKTQANTIVCECKAYKSKIEKEVIETWISNKIPVIYDWIREHDNDTNVIFEFWSVSGFTEEAESLLSQKQTTIKKYKIEFYDEKAILKKARESKAQKMVEIMREYFINI
jgi:arsenate reductase-like glutaredoxin family protein